MFPSTRLGGYRREHKGVFTYRVRIQRHHGPNRVSPNYQGLPSDPVLTADRRGGILISFGLPRTSLEGINPPKRMSSRASRARPRKSAAKTGVAGLGFACFGFHRTSLEGINPPKRCRRRRAELASGIHPEGRIERPSTSLAFCIPSECPVPLKGVGFLLRRSFPTDLRISLQIATNS